MKDKNHNGWLVLNQGKFGLTINDLSTYTPLKHTLFKYLISLRETHGFHKPLIKLRPATSRGKPRKPGSNQLNPSCKVGLPRNVALPAEKPRTQTDVVAETEEKCRDDDVMLILKNMQKKTINTGTRLTMLENSRCLSGNCSRLGLQPEK